MKYGKTWLELSNMEKTDASENQRIEFLCEKIDKLEAILNWNIEVVKCSIISNQRHDRLREETILNTLIKTFTAIKQQLPNFESSQLKEDCTLASKTFSEKSKKLQELDAKERNELEEIGKHLFD